VDEWIVPGVGSGWTELDPENETVG
jgi:hypothetical protein